MTNLYNLAQKSLRQYKKLKSTLEELEGSLNAEYSVNSINLITLYRELDKDCRLLDKQIGQYVNDHPLPEELEDVFSQRRELQVEVFQLIETTLPKAKQIRSVLANEFQSVKRGRNAVSGYKSDSARQGRIINRSS